MRRKYPAKDGYYFVIHWHVWTVLCISALAFSVGFFGSEQESVRHPGFAGLLRRG
jgi:hypothetical protein